MEDNMNFLQSTRTLQKYFPDLRNGKDAPLLIEPPQGLFSISLSASGLILNILRHNQHEGNSCGQGISFSTTFQTSSRFAQIPKLRSIQSSLTNDGDNEEDEGKVLSQGLVYQEGVGKRRNTWSDMPKFLLAGAVSTIISRTCIAPLERIKLECIVYGSTRTWMKIVQLIWASEGLKGFWKGNLVNLFRMIPFKSINFICYDMYLDRLHSIPGKEVTNHDRLIGGGLSGILATVLCLPLDTIRTRLVAPGGEALGGVAGCFRHMVQKEGLLSLYKGLTPALISMGPASAVFYAVYDILKTSYLSHKSSSSGVREAELGPARTLLYGAFAGACAETVTYPLEVIRRQLQLEQSTNVGLISAFIKVLETDGVGSLFAGLAPSTLQVLPSAALSYFFYEMMKSILKIK
ncbi:probable mitochondrial adenine nucleotide transporter BTL3 [Typha angustifolia]|uniref:probable mitochondrial adenine nucleotide transporter BTL3 n=1 Tax=Typha angustifolia TaxID=59011 RepID=UPI003C2BB3E2